MSRFPPTPASQLSADLKLVVEEMEPQSRSATGPSNEHFTIKDERGALLGPFPILMAAPGVGKSLVDLIASVGSLQGFPPDAREVSILVAGARFGAEYERYAHKRVAVKVAGLTQHQADQLAEGVRPDGLSEAANVAYDATHYLVNKPGALSDELFNACEKTFGREGTLALMHYTGLYSYISIILNAGAVPIPEGETM